MRWRPSPQCHCRSLGCWAALRYLKIAFTFVTLTLLCLTCGCRVKQASDASLRSKLTGTWSITLIDPDGSSRSNGTFSVAANDYYQADMFTWVSNQVRHTTLQGFVGIEGGFLVTTITNFIVHWRPEAAGTGQVTIREKIVRMNEQELVIPTNDFGSVLYSRLKP